MTHKLFRDLPDALFRPLAGGNRGIYAEVLADLHQLLGDDDSEDAELEAATVKSCIAETLRRLEISDIESEEDEAPAPEDAANDPHLRIYYRLRDCGWLDETREGFRAVVSIRFAIAELLHTLCRIRDNRRERYGVRVYAVFLSLQAASSIDNQNAAAALMASSQAAGEFGKHLRQMANDVRSIHEQISGLADYRQVLSGFFEDFVAKFLVADYTALKTAHNPFRFHAEITRLTAQIDADDALRAHLARSWLRLEGHSIARMDEGLRAVDEHLNRIRRTFANVQERLARIDSFRSRLETRARNLVLYAADLSPALPARLHRLMESLSRCSDERLLKAGIGDALPLSTADAISVHTLMPPRKARKLREAGGFRDSPRDLTEARRRREDIKAYLARIKPDRERLRSHVETLMAGRPSLKAAEIPVENVDDLLMLFALASLRQGNPVHRQILEGYELIRPGGAFENEYFRADNFSLVRSGHAH